MIFFDEMDEYLTTEAYKISSDDHNESNQFDRVNKIGYRFYRMWRCQNQGTYYIFTYTLLHSQQ